MTAIFFSLGTDIVLLTYSSSQVQGEVRNALNIATYSMTDGDRTKRLCIIHT